MGLQDRDWYNEEVNRLKNNRGNKRNSDNTEWKKDNDWVKLERKINKKTRRVNLGDFAGLVWIALVFFALIFIGSKFLEMKKNEKMVSTGQTIEQQRQPNTIIINQIITPKQKEPSVIVRYKDKQSWIEEALESIEHRPQAEEQRPNIVYTNQARENTPSNAEDNHRRIQEISERERLCTYWQQNGLNYEVETVTTNIRQYCR